ncbi:uncharacterized protein BO72DRAFT_453451 [Aspergillus fijiensis CBS 313.89]|uniref:Uncharacterized protein n=1 Tax=Aspergillus fijiensis CBS 313.89 TaxID=1448319 RepID=A0A8G1RDC9_9EURO|nr:uncharacterized protein BO72DRAFT_453451 [Aspergillus fijiensis CBS 313.89]RAK71692.1 hypothetical protein BO72DRAFT_453451 [Aspergillus fijiensis CBS 313.89]
MPSTPPLSKMGYRMDSWKGETLCGTRVRVGRNSDQTATIGGTVMIDGEYYALTILHPFLKPSSNQHRKRWASFRSRAMYALDSEEPHAVAYLPRYRGTRKLNPGFWSVRQNWALFRLCDQTPRSNCVTVGGWQVLSPSKVTRSSPRGQLWCLLGNGARPPVRTDVSGRLSSLSTAATDFPVAYHLSMVSFAEDVGAWVVDGGDNGSLFAMLVAQDDQDFTTYAISAADIFDELQRRFPNTSIAIA